VFHNEKFVLKLWPEVEQKQPATNELVSLTETLQYLIYGPYFVLTRQNKQVAQLLLRMSRLYDVVENSRAACW